MRLRSNSAAILLALAAVLLSCRPDEPERISVTIRGFTVRAELARTAEERARGLSGRPRLAPDEGMLFLFPEPLRPGFWMPDMHFDLDLVWILGDRVVDLSRFVSRREPEQLHRPTQPVDTVLEVLAGTATLHGWQPGDRVRFDPQEPPPPR